MPFKAVAGHIAVFCHRCGRQSRERSRSSWAIVNTNLAQDLRADRRDACCRLAVACVRARAPGAGAYHFLLHGVIERDPGLLELRRECGTKLLFQAPDQRLAERDEMGWPCAELRMLTAAVVDERLEQLALIECADDGGDHVHELEVLAFQIAREQALRIGSKLEEPAVE